MHPKPTWMRINQLLLFQRSQLQIKARLHSHLKLIMSNRTKTLQDRTSPIMYREPWQVDRISYAWILTLTVVLIPMRSNRIFNNKLSSLFRSNNKIRINSNNNRPNRLKWASKSSSKSMEVQKMLICRRTQLLPLSNCRWSSSHSF